MYTIKQAAARTGMTVPLLRAWERRYGIAAPARTASGYRLYDEAALERIRAVRLLVESGMAPSQAARSVLEAEAAGSPASAAGVAARSATGMAARSAAPASPLDADARLADAIDAFVAAAAELDSAGLESSLVGAVAAMGVDEALERFVLPAMVAIGDAWSDGRLTVASEHAASNAVVRRLSALFEAASAPTKRASVVVGLAPGARHEIGALAFAVACRRVGLSVLYLGPDVPLSSWLEVPRAQPGAVLVLGAVTDQEAEAALEVAATLHLSNPETRLALGGAGAGHLEDRLPPAVAVLPARIDDAVALATTLAHSPAIGAGGLAPL